MKQTLKKILLIMAGLAGAAVLLATVYWKGIFLLPTGDTAFLNSKTTVLFYKGTDLLSIALDGSNEKKLAGGYCSYRWSPDGSKLVLNDHKDVFVLWLDTGRRETITRASLSRDLPEWSPDSARLAYLENPQKKSEYESEIFIHDLVSGKKERVERGSDSYLSGVKWLKDGDHVIFNEVHRNCFYKYSTGDRKIEELSCSDDKSMSWPKLLDLRDVHFNQYVGPSHAGSHMARRSPDRRYVLYAKDCSLWLDGEGKREKLAGYFGLCSRDFGKPGVAGMEWLPDNRTFLFFAKGRVYAGDIVSGKIGALAEGYGPLAHIPGYFPGVERPSVMSDWHNYGGEFFSEDK